MINWQIDLISHAKGIEYDLKILVYCGLQVRNWVPNIDMRNKCIPKYYQYNMMCCHCVPPGSLCVSGALWLFQIAISRLNTYKMVLSAI